ncbi:MULTISPECIES: MBL fold metallo-hydrolase [unclassified Streptomyces]|uniref:MBL fold metallo-hydrolase n=1 Tax=unclassified Streptomyces TaxID=2593676 RepID=UPI0033D6815C
MMATHPALPAVRDWSRVTAIDGTLTLIDEPHVHELLDAHTWLVRGRDRDLLVDCGLGVGDLPALLAQLTDREPTAVLTHAHVDHMGAAHAFAHCWAHPLEAVASPELGSLLGSAWAAQGGLQDFDLPPSPISAVPHAGYDPSSYELRPAHVTRHLRDGDRVDLRDRELTVLHLPGHSPGSIALFDASDGTLFSGDVVYDDVLLDELPRSAREQYVHTMKRLRELPVRTVRPGHGPSFDPQRLRRIIDDCIASAEARATGSSWKPLVPSTRTWSDSRRSRPVRRGRTGAGPSRDPSH